MYLTLCWPLRFVATFGLLLALCANCAAFASDTTAPQLTAFNLSRTEINVLSGPVRITIDFTITDDISGVAGFDFNITSPRYPVQGVLLTTGGGSSGNLSLKGSTGITFPQGSESGNWTIEVVLSDQAGNKRRLSTSDLAAQKFPDHVTVLPATSIGNLSMNPGWLEFNYVLKDVAPAPQIVSVISSASGVDFTAQASTTLGSWLTVAPLSGTANTTVSVSTDPRGLSPGTYIGKITITASRASNSPQSIPVSLIVASGPTILVGSAALGFACQESGTVPPPQTLTIASSPATAFTLTTSGGNWLSVSSMAGITPASVNISANPAGLSVGTYSGKITISAPTAINSPQTVSVTLVVGSPTPSISGVLNGASFANDAFAPGAIVSIFGRALGPDSGAAMSIRSDNSVDTVLAGVRVLFEGHPAPLLFVQAGQINAVVPFEVARQSKVRLQIERDAKQYDGVDILLKEAAPALFTSDASGHGQGAILNQDGRPNSLVNSAQKGSVVVLYASGGGAFDRNVQDGAITGADLARLALPAAVQIDGIDGEILYAGSAPGLVAGVIQINVKLPEQIRSGGVPVVLKVGSVSSQSGVTVAVQ
jgi:uncharacterized protein (TIGR03437 family)